jgi:hypothetical protein
LVTGIFRQCVTTTGTSRILSGHGEGVAGEIVVTTKYLENFQKHTIVCHISPANVLFGYCGTLNAEQMAYPLESSLGYDAIIFYIYVYFYLPCNM